MKERSTWRLCPIHAHSSSKAVPASMKPEKNVPGHRDLIEAEMQAEPKKKEQSYARRLRREPPKRLPGAKIR